MSVPTLDWLSLTIKDFKIKGEIPRPVDLKLDIIGDILGMYEIWECFVPMKGIHFYESRYSYQGITINVPRADRLTGDGTSEKSGMGYNITLSGSGLRFFMDYHLHKNKEFSLQSWLSFVYEFYEVKCSRIDVAMDDLIQKGETEARKPLLEFDRVMEHVTAGLFKTRSKKMYVTQADTYQLHKDSDTGFCKPEPSGKTLYFGSQKSEKYTRIYDKLAEQRLKHPNEESLKEITHWVRCETEYKGNTAQEILKMFINPEWEQNYCSHLRDMLCFLERDGETASWWAAFCNDMEPVHLKVDRKRVDTGNFIHMRNTFFYQMGRKAFTIMVVLGPQEFYNQLLSEESRLKKQHWSIIHKRLLP